MSTPEASDAIAGGTHLRANLIKTLARTVSKALLAAAQQAETDR